MLERRSGGLLLIGALVAGALLGMARRLPFGVEPLDRSVFAIASACILLRAAAAALIPVLRALKTDPLTAWRGVKGSVAWRRSRGESQA